LSLDSDKNTHEDFIDFHNLLPMMEMFLLVAITEFKKLSLILWWWLVDDWFVSDV